MNDDFQLVCAHCGELSQVPDERLEHEPVCGHCGQALLPLKPMAVDGALLQRFIEQSDLPLMVDFWAPWCGPCVSFAPIFEGFAKDVGYQLRCLKVDTQAQQEAAAAHNIRSIPTLILFRGGQEVDRQTGLMQPWQLAKWVLEKLAS